MRSLNNRRTRDSLVEMWRHGTQEISYIGEISARGCAHHVARTRIICDCTCYWTRDTEKRDIVSWCMRAFISRKPIRATRREASPSTSLTVTRFPPPLLPPPPPPFAIFRHRIKRYKDRTPSPCGTEWKEDWKLKILYFSREKIKSPWRMKFELTINQPISKSLFFFFHFYNLVDCLISFSPINSL